MKTRVVVTLLVTFVALYSSILNAEELSDQALYARCYGQLLRKQPATFPASLSATSATAAGPDACFNLFKKANLSVNAAGVYSNSDPEGLEILRTMQNFHYLKWSGKANHEEKLMRLNPDIVDTQEVATHLTRVLFGDNVAGGAYNPIQFKQFFIGNQSFDAVRDLGNDINDLNNFLYPLAEPQDVFPWGCGVAGAQKQGNCPTYIKYGHINNAGGRTLTDFVPTLVERGKFIGIKPATTTNQVPYSRLYNSPINLNAHIPNSGAIGTASYVQYNYFKERDILANGGLRSARNFTKNLIKDFMCRDIPVVRSQDMTNIAVDPASDLPFRQSASCMQCHATIDYIPGVIRNYAVTSIGHFDANSYFRVYGLHKFSVSQPADNYDPRTYTNTNDVNFHRRPSMGWFFYNTYIDNGDWDVYRSTPISTRVDSLGEVAQIIADDILDGYVCATKRYYEFFTGVKVSMAAEGLSPVDKAHRDFVVGLARDLKTNQRLQDIIRDIMHTNVYRDRFYQGNPIIQP